MGGVDPLPVKEFRRLDLNSEEMGVPVERLMARAGKALADAVEREAKGGSVVFLCGKGNNGGDGFAAAGRLLERGLRCTVVLLAPAADVKGSASRRFLQALPSGSVVPWKGSRRGRWKDAAVIVDCMLGSGISGRPRPPFDAAIKWAHAHDARRVACDIPSGLGSPLAFRPHRTVTFHAPKEGMQRSNSGIIEVAPIGIPKAARTDIGLGDLDAGYMRPGAASHKGDNGRVLIVGGGPFSGAPHYAGMGAYRAGADLVHLCTPEETARTVASWGPDILVHAVCEGSLLAPVAKWGIEEVMGRVDAVLVGPGIGRDEGTRELAAETLALAAKRRLPVVVDADGLDPVDEDFLARHGDAAVLTPHAAEFQDLSGWKPVQANVTRYAREHGTVVLRKGAVDVVSDGYRTRLCRRGHPTMTVGGTGDVLAGAVAGLMAKGATPFDAACAGAYLVGRAGEIAASYRSWGATATDVHEAMPSVLVGLQ